MPLQDLQSQFQVKTIPFPPLIFLLLSYHTLSLHPIQNSHYITVPNMLMSFISNSISFKEIYLFILSGPSSKFFKIISYECVVMTTKTASAKKVERYKMIILIPFFLQKLRSALSQSRSEINKKTLKNLIENDIVNSIKTNLAFGNISEEDGRKLRDMIQKLYWHI